MRRVTGLLTVGYIVVGLIVVIASYIGASMYFGSPIRLPFGVEKNLEPVLRQFSFRGPPLTGTDSLATFSGKPISSADIVAYDQGKIGPPLYNVRLTLTSVPLHQGNSLIGTGVFADDEENHPVTFAVTSFPNGVVIGFHSQVFRNNPEAVEMVPYASASSILVPGRFVQLPVNPEQVEGTDWQTVSRSLNALAARKWDVLKTFTIPAFGIEIIR